ncbi:hypothetical protein HFP89_00120 [Wenzhouxiangella sp. XN79A]|uniref:hypothetical protein n=1 Tax=Wenzhouxiangella sp. XN79A TaxID=2724193 RepID=UPI00144A81BC|nr:hypothetical protein [Wenzhouxiangella sp. XN79A]NKI33567.1 hypothetical protein [Wenzhouxiangella sp. XN79A]
MVPSPLRVVFVPASGPTGSGEYYRALNLSRALRRIAPGLETHVLRARSAGVLDDEGLQVHPLDATPARADRAVRERLTALRPALAVFDGSGRTAQLRTVRRLGGRVAWISNRPGRRRRALAWRRLRWIDLHLMLVAEPDRARLGRFERLRAGRVPAAEQRFVGAIAPPAGALPDPLAARIAAQAAVFVSGGGGQVCADGTPVPDLFVAAAARYHAATGRPACVVLGPQYAGTPSAPSGVVLIDALPPEQLGALLAGAGLVVAGAGNMLSNQVVLAGRPCVMTATGGHDQPRRLAAYAARGAVQAAPLSATALADAAIALSEDAAARRALIDGLARLGLRNDTERVAGWLADLAGARQDGRP